MMPARILNANDAVLPEIVHKHRVLRSGSMIDIGESIQNTASKNEGEGKINSRVVRSDNFFRNTPVILKLVMFLVVFYDKSERLADLPYIGGIGAIESQFEPIKVRFAQTKTLTNNEELLTWLSGNRLWIHVLKLLKSWVSEISTLFEYHQCRLPIYPMEIHVYGCKT
jgi:hypothetical protein